MRRSHANLRVALCAAIVWACAASAPASASEFRGPTLAREDTLHASVPEVLVTAPRMTLDEILDHIARAERRRDSLLVDESFVATMRLMRARDEHATPTFLEESVVQVYRKRPNRARTLLLRHRRDRSDRGGAEVQFNFRGDMSEEIVNFAFRPEARRDYRYHIVGRDLAGDQVIYRIRFEPRSMLDPSIPSGIVWVNTNDFVIVRQELDFERSPAPLVIKGVDRMVIERQEIGNFWVLARVLLRARFTFPVPRLGRRLDFSMQFDHYALNSGLPDSLFAAAGSR
jgi:hypothetical protein